tara:strand:+ start:739 stop:993 length:255 start_codon:yes stop_codon:yes gene_type:complete
MSISNEYSWSFRGTCPVDGKSDKYRATINTDMFVEINDLLKFCEKREGTPIFQEQHTEDLQKHFGGVVTIVGYHKGVKVRSIVQ